MGDQLGKEGVEGGRVVGPILSYSLGLISETIQSLFQTPRTPWKMHYLKISTSDIFMKLLSKHLREQSLLCDSCFLHGLKMKVQEGEDG